MRSVCHKFTLCAKNTIARNFNNTICQNIMNSFSSGYLMVRRCGLLVVFYCKLHICLIVLDDSPTLQRFLSYFLTKNKSEQCTFFLVAQLIISQIFSLSLSLLFHLIQSFRMNVPFHLSSLFCFTVFLFSSLPN